jgi:drug/metabolite transporter (DMT)-like permease
MSRLITKREWLVITVGAILGVCLMCVMMKPASSWAYATCFVIGTVSGGIGFCIWCILMRLFPQKSHRLSRISNWLKERKPDG